MDTRKHQSTRLDFDTSIGTQAATQQPH